MAGCREKLSPCIFTVDLIEQKICLSSDDCCRGIVCIIVMVTLICSYQLFPNQSTDEKGYEKHASTHTYRNIKCAHEGFVFTNHINRKIYT